MVFKIKEFREEKNWTQEKLSEESGVSRTIIAGLESDAIKVTTTSTLLKLSKALKKPVNEIFFANKV